MRGTSAADSARVLVSFHPPASAVPLYSHAVSADRRSPLRQALQGQGLRLCHRWRVSWKLAAFKP